MEGKEYTYLVSYAGTINGCVMNGHIELTSQLPWSKGDTGVFCEKIQQGETTPDKVAILSVFELK